MKYIPEKGKVDSVLKSHEAIGSLNDKVRGQLLSEEPKPGLHGFDNRVLVREIPNKDDKTPIPERYKALHDIVACVVPSHKIYYADPSSDQRDSNQNKRLRSIKLNDYFRSRGMSKGKKRKLSRNERFQRYSRVDNTSTGFFITEKFFLTTAHAIWDKKRNKPKSTNDFVLLSGYLYHPSFTGKNSFSFRKVEKIVDYKYSVVGEDWALLQLETPLTCKVTEDKPILNALATIQFADDIPDSKVFNQIISPKEGQKASTKPFKPSLFSMGHPFGIEKVIAANGKIFKNSLGLNDRGFLIEKPTDTKNPLPIIFTTNLDLYSGDSGSPVFFERTEGEYIIIGMTMRGERDLTQDKHGAYATAHHSEHRYEKNADGEKCKVSRRNTFGEQCLILHNIKEIANAFPKTPREHCSEDQTNESNHDSQNMTNE